MINEELKKFNPELSERPMLVAGNKCDLAQEGQAEGFAGFVRERGYEFFPIMAAIRYGVDPLIRRIDELLQKLPPVKRYEPEPEPKRPVEEFERNAVSVENRNGVYVVEGEWLLPVLRSINFDDADSLRYFERVLLRTGVDDALRRAGVKEGDTVGIYGVEFDYVE